MGVPQNTISPQQLKARIGTADCPLIVDVRRDKVYAEATDLIPTARWRDHRAADQWARELAPGREVVAYCVHGHQVSQAACALLAAAGIRARYLEGGIEGYREAGGITVAKTKWTPVDRPSRWVTRERPKIDRIACPWFIRRFFDSDAAIYYVASDQVKAAAGELDAEPFDITDPGIAFSHVGELCSFDAFLDKFQVRDPALDRLAVIIRGADTARLDLAPQCAGLLAVSLGLSATCADDAEMFKKGMIVYDALYGWCRHAQGETHNWPTVKKDKAYA
jgi:rhodanese-related sulfurtransferase